MQCLCVRGIGQPTTSPIAKHQRGLAQRGYRKYIEDTESGHSIRKWDSIKIILTHVQSTGHEQ